jgi:hypothetical protein
MKSGRGVFVGAIFFMATQLKGPEVMLLWARDTMFCPLPRNLLLRAVELTT